MPAPRPLVLIFAIGRMRMCLVAAVTSGLLVCAAVPATATSSRSCGVVRGWRIAADPETTTCGLARSAGRYFAGQAARGEATSRHIYGWSPKTGRQYRFTRIRRGLSPSRRSVVHVYTGRAGDEVLRVTISATLY